MKKVKVGKSKIHGKGLFTQELIKKGELILPVHSGIPIDNDRIRFVPNQFGKFYNHDEKNFNTSNEVIGDKRYLRALKNIPAGSELTANYREHSEMEQPEDFGKGKYASFDFDKTIATPEGLAKAKKMFRDGYNLFIVSARDKVTPDMIARARQAGIPVENIIATGSDEAKVRKVKQLGVEKHFDDKPEVIAALGSVGEQFRKGGSLNSMKYTKSIFGKNKLFVKNKLFKRKKVKNRIYDPNAKYYEDGGLVDYDRGGSNKPCGKGQVWNPYTKRCENALVDYTPLYLLQDEKRRILENNSDEEFKKYLDKTIPKRSYNPTYIQNLKEVTIKASKKAKAAAKKANKKTDTFSSYYQKLVEQYEKLKNSPLLADQETAAGLLREIKEIELYDPGSTQEILYRGNSFEDKINSALDNPMDKAAMSAYGAAKEDDDPIDNFRHPQGGRYAAEAIMDYFPDWAQYTGIPQAAGFLGANAMGVGHELETIFNDDRPWLVKFTESGEDILNNAVGAGVGILPMSSRDKTNALLELSNQNMLPDGIVNKNPANNVYLKKGPNDPGQFMSPYKQELGGSLHKFIAGGSPCDDGYTYDPKLGCIPLSEENMTEDQRWMVEWYKNRKIDFPEDQPSFKKVVEKALPAYNPESPMLKQMQSFPVYETMPEEYTQENIGGFRAVGMYDTSGKVPKIYFSPELTPEQKSDTERHELTNYLMEPVRDKLYPMYDKIVKENIIPFDKTWPKEKQQFYDYIINPEEQNIQSYLNVARKKFNLKPDEVITPERLNQMREEAEKKGMLDKDNKNFNQDIYLLFRTAKDDESLMRLFNLIAKKDSNKDDIQYGKYGGSLDKFIEGGSPCGRGYYRNSKGECVPLDWNLVDVDWDYHIGPQAEGWEYDRNSKEWIKNKSGINIQAKKGKKLSDWILRGGKTRLEQMKDFGKKYSSEFGIGANEPLISTNTTKEGIKRFKSYINNIVSEQNKYYKNEEKERKEYEKARKKAQSSKDLSAGTKFRMEYEEKGWDRFDPNVMNEAYKGQFQEAVDEANKRKEANMGVTNTALELLGGGAYRIVADPVGTAEGVAKTVADVATLPQGLVEGAVNYSNTGNFDMGTNVLTGENYGSGINQTFDVLGAIPGINAISKLSKFTKAGDLVTDLGKGVKSTFQNTGKINSSGASDITLQKHIDDIVANSSFKTEQEAADFLKEVAKSSNKTVNEVLNTYSNKGFGFSNSNLIAAAEVIKNDLKLPVPKYLYHGTSDARLKNILSSELDNSLGDAVNTGGMMPDKLGKGFTTAAGDSGYALNFAGYSAEATGGKPVLLRFANKGKKDLGFMGQYPAVKGKDIEYSLDGGKTWSKQLPGSPNSPVSNMVNKFFNRPPGPMMLLGPSGSGSNMVKKNLNYYKQLLDSYDSKKMSFANRKFYNDLIETGRKQGDMLTEAQLRELDRLKNSNFDFGKRGYNKESLLQVEPKAPIEGGTPPPVKSGYSINLKGAFQRYPKGPLTEEEILAYKNSPEYQKFSQEHADLINKYGSDWTLPNYMDEHLNEAITTGNRSRVNPILYGGRNWNATDYTIAGLVGSAYPGAAAVFGTAFSPPPIKNKILKNVGVTGVPGGLSSKDTLIDITNTPMDFAKVNETKDGKIIIGGEFIEDANNTVRKAKDWLTATDTYSDKKYPSNKIESFYGIEDGKFKVGKANEFDPDTEIVPRRFGAKNIDKAIMNGNEMRLLDKNGDPIYQNTPNTGKFILYSPSTKKAEFAYITSGKKGVDLVNDFLKKNKDAQYIHLDNGRYEYYGLNPGGLTKQDFESYYHQDLGREGTPGYNLIIKEEGGETDYQLGDEVDEDTKGYLESLGLGYTFEEI